VGTAVIDAGGRKLLMADVVAVVAVAEAVQAAPADTVATAVCAKITSVPAVAIANKLAVVLAAMPGDALSAMFAAPVAGACPVC
jgi:hypothetical protein